MSPTLFYFLWLIGAILAVYAAIKLDARFRREEDARINARFFEQFNEQAGIHPLDDVYELDSWPQIERWMDENPEEIKRIQRAANAHREEAQR